MLGLREQRLADDLDLGTWMKLFLDGSDRLAVFVLESWRR